MQYQVREKYASRSSSGDTAQVVYLVKTSSRAGHAMVLRASGLPREGDFYREPGYTDTTLVAEWPPSTRQIARLWWEVTVQYKKKTSDLPGDGITPPGKEVSPLMLPPKWTFGGQYMDLYLQHDATGKPLLNSAGHPLDGIAIPWPIGVVTVTRNEAYWDTAKVRNYRGRVNNSAWYGYPAEMVLCYDIRGQSETQGKWSYFSVTYEFHTLELKGADGKDLGWVVEVLDRGPYSREWNPAHTKQEIALPVDRDKQKFGGLVPLNKDGTRLTDAQVNAKAFNWLKFTVRKGANFDGLRL